MLAARLGRILADLAASLNSENLSLQWRFAAWLSDHLNNAELRPGKAKIRTDHAKGRNCHLYLLERQ
ncbi:hypothetical protein FMM02_00340 [Sphingomonas xanthus]|uniref:Uncharacterized protein n=1 Tax=Sphingomonas xanthus TaxID=2594473 RepID=A0A516IU67_9SPHN|nr:hypothetical protein FMM02_00340 [Sphingomonas xanthus]